MDNVDSEMDESHALDVVVPSAPPQPWVRLAHRMRVGFETTRGRVRRLDDFEIVFQIDGTTWWRWEPSGVTHRLPAGCALLVPPGQAHAFGLSPGEHVAIHFDLHWSGERAVHDVEFDDHERVGQVVEPVEWTAAPLIRLCSNGHRVATFPAMQRVNVIDWTQRTMQIVSAVDRRRGAPPWWEPRVAAHLLDLVSEFIPSPRPGSSPSERLSRIVADVPADASPSLADLARRAGISEARFRATFVDTYGVTPRAFFERRRVDTAVRLLRTTDQQVAEIGRVVGYDDPYHFSRVVRRVTGRPPSDWR